MPLSLPPFLRRHGITVLLVALLAGSFTAYAVCAQRYIGAVDWYGYYQEGMLFKAGRTTLPTELPAAEFPSIVPLGFSVNAQGAVVAQYPPGFPVLLALGGFLGLECYVAPLIGAASCLLLFLLIADLTGDRATALLYAFAVGLLPHRGLREHRWWAASSPPACVLAPPISATDGAHLCSGRRCCWRSRSACGRPMSSTLTLFLRPAAARPAG